MESVIRKLEKEELPDFVNIVLNAYPGTTENTPEFKERFTNTLTYLQEEVEDIDFYGLFRNGKLLGGMRIHYFKMNVFGNLIDAGGVGQVAVDFLHKKEKVAKDLISYFIDFFKERRTPIVMLYPFRPDFYKKMGFGYGMKKNQYYIEPSSFPKTSIKKELVFLDHSHKESIKDCYNSIAKSRHGMIINSDYEIEKLFKNPNNKLIGLMEDGRLKGYILFSFKKVKDDHFLLNDLLVHHMVYKSPEVLAQFCNFFNSQADQIHRISLHTQDEGLEFMLEDPRNGTNNLIPSVFHETNTAGVGLMYKILDVEKILTATPRLGISCKFNVVLHDSFHSPEPQKFMIHSQDGKISIEEYRDHEDRIELDISDFSSLIMGVVDARTLYRFGKLTITNTNLLNILNEIFNVHEKPVCTTLF
ncbi:GNAT family N-acetyltransferase [Peribacillus alkalitolerans]|uniref:GNAT family N-acetyltransferase n=1 Tax=Peribacillus alkalitolerans TaxID=1550385 RepID=UPI0013D2A07D|nr:GNAT family N-acetyltransferase [Peribacillus alkalitolerans]